MTKPHEFYWAEQLPYGILILDEETHVCYANPPALQLLPDKKSLYQKPLTEQLALQQITQPLTKSDATFEEIDLKGNLNLRLSLSLRPYSEQRWILLIEDITHLSHLEKMRQDFVANVSHELRTPLTVIHGYLETLQNEENASLLPYNKFFKQMYQQSLRMERLVNDLLLLSRLEACQPDSEEYSPIDVPALLTSITQEAKAVSHGRHCFSEALDEGLLLNGLYDELQSAFSNLIFNAVKYTPEGGKISIRWFKTQNEACLEICDTGIGIAAKHIPRLTERFYRADRARSRSSGGTGLGLAIVKHVLLRHGASLQIHSDLGKGSLFCCRFPANLLVGV